MVGLLKRYGWGILSGIVLALCFPTWGLFPLAWLALAPLFVCAFRRTPRECFVLFFVSGYAFFIVLLQWLLTNIYWGGGWAFWGLVMLCAILAAHWAVLGALWAWLRDRCSWLPAVAAMVVLWPAMEFVQARIFSGFGWGSLAYSQGKDLALLQWAAIGGAPLVSTILVAGNVLVAQAIAERSRRLLRLAGALVLVAVVHAAGWALLDEPDYSKELSVGLVQADFPLEMKWDHEYTAEMVRNAAEKSRLLARRKPVDLFVWPEALVMTDIDAVGIGDQLASLTKDTGTPLFTGSHRSNPDTGGGLNSSYLIGADGEIIDHYDKCHLAPFGEYTPFADYLPFVAKVVPAIGNAEAGTELKTLSFDGHTFGPLICFEVLFAPMAEELRGKGAEFLVVITNLGWFGSSNAIPQELDIARVRAIETRLSLAHCANTGISGTFDPWGRFTGIRLYPVSADSAVRIRDEVGVRHTIMERLVGATPVAAPGPRPIPGGPTVFPPAAAILSVALVGAGLLSRKKRTADS